MAECDAKPETPRELYERLGRKTAAVARELGVNWHTANKLINEAAEAEPEPEVPAEPERTMERTEGDSGASVEFTTDERIRTLDDAVRYAEVDLAVWRVKKWSCGSYEVTMKVSQGHDARGRRLADVPVRKTMWRVRLELERVLPKALYDATSALIDRLNARPFIPTERVCIPTAGGESHLLAVDLFDVHFGKLAWKPETGQNYDLKIAGRVFRNAVEDLMAKASGHDIARILFPLGNDFLHVDTLTNTTTNGTPQDTDGRLAKIIETAEAAFIEAVEYLVRFAPVDVVLVAGNHDRSTSYMMARAVRNYFRNDSWVTVDVSPASRKKYVYGNTLIGLCHGDDEKIAELPLVMATEWKHDWAATDCHEWMIGHRHRRKETRTVAVNEHMGVVLRELSSLSAVDAWHYRNLYVGVRRSADAVLYGFDSGYAGNFVANVRE